jgi:hypothetical protein
MTDIRDRLARLLANEPEATDPIEAVLVSGRRALRRRNTLVAVAGTAGTAAVTAAVVVPASFSGSHGHDATVSTAGQPTEPTPPPCQLYYAAGGHAHQNVQAGLKSVAKQWRAQGRKVYSIHWDKLRHGFLKITVCSGPHHGGVKITTAPAPAGPSAPKYHYTDDPKQIADGFGARLTSLVGDDGLDVVFTRPFAQESATMDGGHPSYFTGDVDVNVAGGTLGDIGVQVRHDVTTQVPFTGACRPSSCTETTLPDGSVLQTGSVNPGGGGSILTAEIHRPDGVVVQAQESNYGFGPEAPPRQYGDQPLTIDQLASLAEDSAFTF